MLDKILADKSRKNFLSIASFLGNVSSAAVPQATAVKTSQQTAIERQAGIEAFSARCEGSSLSGLMQDTSDLLTPGGEESLSQMRG